METRSHPRLPGRPSGPPGVNLLALLSAVLVGCASEPVGVVPPTVDGAVSAGTPEATLAGLEILSRGGNAVDAAVAVSLALGVTEPAHSGLGGSVIMLVRPPGGAAILIDLPREAAAAGADPRVPGSLRVLHHAWRRFGSGRVSWEELFAPAIEAAEEGYALGRFSHRTLVREYDRVLSDSVATRLLLAPDRSIPAEASTLTNPELATTLRRLAAGGPTALYGDTRPDGGDRADTLDSGTAAPRLAARETAALRGSYAGRAVWVAPEPYGGRFLLEALRFLENAPTPALVAPGWARAAWFAEALAYMWDGHGRSPASHLASLPPMPVTLDTTSVPSPLAEGPYPSTDAGDGVGALSVEESAEERVEDGSERPASGGETSSFSIVDGEGTAVAVTQTLGAPFGSGRALRGLGFFLPDPSRSAADARLLSPALVTRDGEVEMVLGSPGGDRGIAALVQVLARRLGLEESLEDAVLAPRVHVARALDESRGTLFLEGVVWDDPLSVHTAAHEPWGGGVEALARARGFSIGERDLGPAVRGLDSWFGGVNAVARSADGWSAVADERRDGLGAVLQGGAPLVQSGSSGVLSPYPSSSGTTTPAGP